MTDPSAPLTAADVARHLRRLAVVYEDQRTGNLPLGRAIVGVAALLDRYASKPIDEVLRTLDRVAVERGVAIKRDPPPRSDKVNWQSHTRNELRNIFERDELTKASLIDLAQAVFGMSPSSFQKLNKMQVRERLRAAFDNDRALEDISRHASESGASRKS